MQTKNIPSCTKMRTWEETRGEAETWGERHIRGVAIFSCLFHWRHMLSKLLSCYWSEAHTLKILFHKLFLQLIKNKGINCCCPLRKRQRMGTTDSVSKVPIFNSCSLQTYKETLHYHNKSLTLGGTHLVRRACQNVMIRIWRCAGWRRNLRFIRWIIIILIF